MLYVTVYLQLFRVPFLIKHHGIPAINLHELPTQARPGEKLELEHTKVHERCCIYWVLNVELSWLLGGLTPLGVGHLYDEYL